MAFNGTCMMIWGVWAHRCLVAGVLRVALLFGLFYPFAASWCATPLVDVQLTGTGNRLEAEAELTLGPASTLSAAPGSVVDFFHATLSLPEDLSLKNIALSGTASEIRDGGMLSLLSGSRFLAKAGSIVDLSSADLILPAVVVLTSESQTLFGKTLVAPTISSLTSASGEDLFVSAADDGASLKLHRGPDGDVVLTPRGTGRAIVNGLQLYAETLESFNTFAGYESGREILPAAKFNTGLGYYALAHLTSGYGNTALGVQALFRNTTGNYNLGVGVEALVNNTTGLNNTAVGGYDTLFSNTGGSDNAALGYAAGYKNTTGSSNVAIGTAAMYMNSTSSGIVAIGASAGYSNIGPFNTFVGALSGAYFDNTGYDSTGGQNTFLGALSGSQARSSSNNTFVGHLSGRDFTTGDNNIAIGAGVSLPSPVGDNQVNVGNRLIASSSGAVGLVAGGTGGMVYLTPMGGAPVSVTGVAGMIGTAKPLSRYVDIGTTENDAVVGVNLGIFEGERNARVAFFLDDGSGTYGFNATASSGLPQFVIQNAGITSLTIRPTGEALYAATTSATRTGQAAIATAGGIYADKNIFVRGEIATLGRIVASGGLEGGTAGLAINSSIESQGISFGLGAAEVARFSATSGNLLVGGSTDIAGTGGVKVFGGTPSVSPSSGAFQVVGGVGVGGALNVAGTFSFGGNGIMAGELLIAGGTASMSPATGALQVLGGVGIGATLNVAGSGTFGGAVRILGDIATENELGFHNANGSIYYGSIGVAGAPGAISSGAAPSDLVVRSQASIRVAAGGPTDRLVVNAGDGAVTVSSTVASTSISTGALVVGGGLGVAGNQYLGGSLKLPGNSSLSSSSGDLLISAGGADNSIVLAPSGSGTVSVAGSLSVAGDQSTSGNLVITASTPAVDTNSGALAVTGGASIQKELHLGEDLRLTPANAVTSSIRLSGTAVTDTPGLWFRDGGSPTAANVALAGSSAGTILNAPADGTVSLRIGDTGYVTIASSAVTLSAVPLRVTSSAESTSPTTGSATFAGGIGVAGRTTTKTLSVGGGAVVDLVVSVLTTIDFASIAPNGGTQEQSVVVPGAGVADDVNVVEAGAAFVPAGVILRAIVTAPNTVVVRATNVSANAIDPASLPLRVTVTSF